MDVVKKFSDAIRKSGFTLSVAESCTGGLISHLVTSAPGSSDYFLCGFVAYSNESKTGILGVPPETIEKYGAVSGETVARMLEGATAKTGSDAAIAVSGIAGPSGGTEDKPVGTVFIGVSAAGKTRIDRHLFRGGRDEIKTQAAEAALRSLISFIGENVES
ncbi:MAG: CinA family protein [Deltaproteobacteria bacterium]|nr:CinA family protein [Deltaproteobacteria bacterium]